jgi:hypothetical protein
MVKANPEFCNTNAIIDKAVKREVDVVVKGTTVVDVTSA